MRRYVRLTKEEGLELKKMRQEAGLNCSEAATCMSSDVSQIKAFERGGVGIDPYF
jgi:DNA-binding transcriptional regulator YiaG